MATKLSNCKSKKTRKNPESNHFHNFKYIAVELNKISIPTKKE